MSADIGDTVVVIIDDRLGTGLYGRVTAVAADALDLERTAADPWGQPYQLWRGVRHGFKVGQWCTASEGLTHHWHPVAQSARSFQHQDLRGADLRGADLCGADFTGADLRGADLTSADLGRSILAMALLYGANLERADLTDAVLPDFQVAPEVGGFIAYKATVESVLELWIPDTARRTSTLVSRDGRAEAALVLAAETPSASGAYHSKYDPAFVYRVGKVAVADAYDDDIRLSARPGIHFFITRAEAVRAIYWQHHPSTAP